MLVVQKYINNVIVCVQVFSLNVIAATSAEVVHVVATVVILQRLSDCAHIFVLLLSAYLHKRTFDAGTVFYVRNIFSTDIVAFRWNKKNHFRWNHIYWAAQKIEIRKYSCIKKQLKYITLAHNESLLILYTFSRKEHFFPFADDGGVDDDDDDGLFL